MGVLPAIQGRGEGQPPFNNIPEGNTDRAIFSVLSRY